MTGNRLNLPLETGRLVLRELRFSDAATIETYVSDADVACMTASIPHPYPEGNALVFLHEVIPEYESGKSFGSAIVLKEDGEDLIGTIEVSGLTGKEPEVSYWLGKPFWGQGLMSEALAAIVGMVFSNSSHKTLYARTDLNNEASKKVLLKAGFVEAGIGRCVTPAREECSVAANLFELQYERWADRQE